jgi:Ca2+-transporting ATPase
MESEELEKISESDLAEKIENITVFSRVTPNQKLKIVKALQIKGEVVAMTGDGVNDALALKKANIAVVVSGASDVAKEVSDLILLDNNFRTIYYACEEGRIILFNIKKAISFLLSHSFVGIAIIFLAVLFDLPAPLTILMILWINLICDGPIDIMLGFEEKEEGIMKIPPQNLQKEKILDRFVIQTAVVISLFVGIATIILFYYFYNQSSDLSLARTIALSTVATANLICVFSFKNLHKSIFQNKHLFRNKFLLASVLYGAILAVAVVYLPFLNRIFETKPLGVIHWIYILGIGVLAMLLVELSKKTYMKRK